jgi:drug/metabolite transporter (DMT)-like permease
VPQSPNHPITLLPYLALAFGILAVSMAAILVRWANAPATVMGFWRMFIASLVMTLPVAISGFGVRVQSSRFEVHASRFTLHASRFTPLSLAALAGVFFAFNLTAWNLGALTTTAANVTLLGNLSVVWVPLASLWLFKRTLRAAFWIGLVCAMSGVVIILSQDLVAHPALGVGDGFGIVASIVYTGYLLTMERARANVSALVAWWISTTTSAVVLLMLCLALGAPLTGYPLASYAIFVTMALANQIGGFLSLNYALGYVPAPIVSTSLLAQPVLTALFAIPLLGQSLGLVQILGSVLVMTGIVIAHRARV